MACCNTCACIGSGVECLSVLDPAYAHFRTWCASTADDDTTTRLRQHVLARSRIGLAPAPPPVPRTSPRGDVPGFAAQLANIARVKRCPHWEKTSECGCGMNRCKAGKGRAGDDAVGLQDCFQCLGIPT